MALADAAEKVLKPHFTYSPTKGTAKEARQYMKKTIDSIQVPSSRTPPSVLVVPGWQHDQDADRGVAAALKSVQDNIDQYDTIVVVGGYFPDQCGVPPPSNPLTAYWGDKVETHIGDFEIDKELRDKIGASTGQTGQLNSTNELVEESNFFDHPMIWLRSLFPEGKTPKTKVLPLMLYATLRDQVQFTAQVLSDKLFKPKENGKYGVAADGKRYLLIVPIQISEGLSLFQNIYIENILLDLTIKNKPEDFEQWLYYLTGNTGASFSNTIASQILVVRLSKLAEKAVPNSSPSDPLWQWRMLYYYTTFDPLMNRQKMIDLPYREKLPSDEDWFSDDDDSPAGHQIYYAMSLSLEPPLHVSEIERDGRKLQSKMPMPVANPWPFSKGAMEELMLAAQQTMMGKEYKKLDLYNKYEKEFSQAAPYQIRVYVLAEHKHEKTTNSVLDKDVAEEANVTARPNAADCTCREYKLFEVRKQNFFPDKSIFESVMAAAQEIYEERLAPQVLAKFEKELRKKHAQLVKEGLLSKQKLKDVDLNLNQNLIVEIQVFHSWEYKELFSLTEARGSFISLWDGRQAICDVPESKPEVPSMIFFRLAQCALKNGLEPWDWQRGVVHVFDRTRLTRPVNQPRKKDEL